MIVKANKPVTVSVRVNIGQGYTDELVEIQLSETAEPDVMTVDFLLADLVRDAQRRTITKTGELEWPADAADDADDD